MWRKVKQEKKETASKPLSSKGSDARESKGMSAKAWVSKGNPEQAPESFARSLYSLASLASSSVKWQKNKKKTVKSNTSNKNKENATQN